MKNYAGALCAAVGMLIAADAYANDLKNQIECLGAVGEMAGEGSPPWSNITEPRAPGEEQKSPTILIPRYTAQQRGFYIFSDDMAFSYSLPKKADAKKAVQHKFIATIPDRSNVKFTYIDDGGEAGDGGWPNRAWAFRSKVQRSWDGLPYKEAGSGKMKHFPYTTHIPIDGIEALDDFSKALLRDTIIGVLSTVPQFCVTTLQKNPGAITTRDKCFAALSKCKKVKDDEIRDVAEPLYKYLERALPL